MSEMDQNLMTLTSGQDVKTERDLLREEVRLLKSQNNSLKSKVMRLDPN